MWNLLKKLKKNSSYQSCRQGAKFIKTWIPLQVFFKDFVHISLLFFRRLLNGS